MIPIRTLSLLLAISLPVVAEDEFSEKVMQGLQANEEFSSEVMEGLIAEDFEMQDELINLNSRPQSNLLNQEIPTLQTLDTSNLPQPEEGPEQEKRGSGLRPLVQELEKKRDLPEEGTVAPPVVQPAPAAPRRNPAEEALGREELRLWQWLKLGKHSQIESRIKELKSIYPNWNPPQQMVTLLAEARSRKELEQAVKAGNWSMVMFSFKQYPGWFTCDQFYNLWSLADAQQGMGNRDAMVRIYQGIMDNCSSQKVRVDTFKRALPVLTFDELSDMVDDEEARHKNRLSNANLAVLHGELATLRMLEAADQGEDQAVVASIPMLSDRVIREKDSGLALIFGWASYREDRLVEADNWFRRAHEWNPSPQTIQARATMYNRLGRLDDAEALARTDLEDPAMQDLLASVLAQRARDAFNAEDYQSTLDYFDEAEVYAPRELDDEAIYGWSNYHLGNFERAAESFELAYPDSQSPEVAQGLYYSLKESDSSRLRTVASRHEGPLKVMVEEEATEEAFDLGLYHKAYAISPSTYPELKGMDTAGLLGGMFFHFRSGESGTSQLNLQRLPIVSGEADWGQHLFELEVSALSLSSGELRDFAVIGSYPEEQEEPAYTFQPTTELDNSVEPMFRYRYEGSFSPYFSIGTTPTNAPLGSRLQGNLGFGYMMGAGSVGLELYSKPVKESMLSYVGIHDPYSGEAWGGVDRKGFDANVYLKLRERFSSSFSVRSATYVGTDVVSNDMIEFLISARRTWSGDVWEEIGVGPTFSFQRFDQNLSFFTRGHGGYFSPQQLFKFGGELSLASHDLRDFVSTARVAIGFQQHKSDCAPLFPQESNLCSENYLLNKDEGLYLNTEIMGMILADSHVQVGGGVFYSTSPEFDEFGFMLALRLTAEPRKSMIKADLPSWFKNAH